MLVKNRDGSSPLHAAANYGVLNEVPPDVLTLENMFAEDNDKMTVLRLAILSEHLDQVPKELFTAEVLLRRAPNDDTLLHELVLRRRLDMVPQDVLISNLLVVGRAHTVLESAIMSNCLEQVPKEVLTPELLSKQDDKGENILVLIALFQQLDRVPSHLLTADNLFWPVSRAVACPLGVVAKFGQLDCIPLGLDFPEEARALTGEVWWTKNQTALSDKLGLSDAAADNFIDIF